VRSRGTAGTASTRTSKSIWLVSAGSVATAIALLCTAIGPVEAAPKPPPNPSNSQLAQASIQKSMLAHTVGVLSAELASAQAQLHSLAAQAELAEQRFAEAEAKLNAAKETAAKAQASVVSAELAITTARRNFTNYVRDSYMSPPVGSTTIGLLTATDPGALLQSGDYQTYISQHHLDAVSALDRATVAKSNADARAKQAVQTQNKLAIAAQQAQLAAQQAYANEKAQAATLQTQQADYQNRLAAAQLQLATLNNQRATFLAYQREQARIAAEKARQRALALQRAHEAQLAELARLAQQAANSGGSSSSSGGSSGQPAPPGPSAGGWSAARGQAAANKALSQLGVAYSWAAGGYFGPTYGVDSPGTDGWNDANVFGFDCSGLTMFGWYPALSLPHFAASQYYSGSFHPQPGQFLPGDLLFWSDGGADAIHHVAMYIGNGNVVQAPNSGDVVRITPWDQVSYGYFGATRPLT
jgi:cell wall-associated NlpC family hydrolase